MAEPNQNTRADSTDSILTQAEIIPSSVANEKSNPVVSVFSYVVDYVKDSWSNHRWRSVLEQREKNLNERMANFDRNFIALTERKAALADKRKALEAMALIIKNERVNLQCAKDTFRAEREELRKETIEQAKHAAKSEYEAMRERAVQELQDINAKIEQREAELLALETKLRNLQDMLAEVTQTLGVGLKECTQENNDSKSMYGKPMYLVPTQADPEVTEPVVNKESSEIKTAADWTASLFSTEKTKPSSSEMIASAACLRVGG